MALIIEDRHVRDLVSMRDAIDALRATYLDAAAGEILEADRSNLVLPNGFLRLMAAAAPARAIAGYKEFHRSSGRVRSTYHLFETDGGAPLAVLDADHLTLLRTGACGGLAADLLARPDASVLGVLGSGKEARSQVAAVLAVRDIGSVKVYSRTAERRHAFCAEIGERYGVEASSCAEPTAAIDGADILVVATVTGNNGPPALLGEWLDRPGLHINSVGSTLPAQREIDELVWERSDRIVIDASVLLRSPATRSPPRRRTRSTRAGSRCSGTWWPEPPPAAGPPPR